MADCSRGAPAAADSSAGSAGASADATADGTIVPLTKLDRKTKKLKNKLHRSWKKLAKKDKKYAKRKMMSSKIVDALHEGLRDSGRSLRDVESFVQYKVGFPIQRKAVKVFFHKMLQKLLLKPTRKKKVQQRPKPKLAVSSNPSLLAERKEKLRMWHADDWPKKYLYVGEPW